MLLEVGTADKAVERVHEMFAKKIKIPGFGHRVYRTDDPRATHLRVMSEELGKSTGHEDLYLMSKRVEETVRGEKKLNPNVDFYSASTYYSLGIPIDLFTPIFAVSRMSGWTAHVLEQYHNNRLIRPRAEYKGNPDGMQWVPMSETIASGRTRVLFGVADEEAGDAELPFLPDAGHVRAELHRADEEGPAARRRRRARPREVRQSAELHAAGGHAGDVQESRDAASGLTFPASRLSRLCKWSGVTV